MNLIRAETKAKYLVKELESFCDRIEIVGNIRRRKQDIDKLDILLAPKSVELFRLMGRIIELGSKDGMKVGDKKTIILRDDLGDIKADLWFTTIDKWPIMLFVKTGGNKSVKRIETLCNSKKWYLSIKDGTIFDESNKKLLIEKEEDIFILLGIPFIEPSWRE